MGIASLNHIHRHVSVRRLRIYSALRVDLFVLLDISRFHSLTHLAGDGYTPPSEGTRGDTWAFSISGLKKTS